MTLMEACPGFSRNYFLAPCIPPGKALNRSEWKIYQLSILDIDTQHVNAPIITRATPEQIIVLFFVGKFGRRT